MTYQNFKAWVEYGSVGACPTQSITIETGRGSIHLQFQLWGSGKQEDKFRRSSSAKLPKEIGRSQKKNNQTKTKLKPN